MMRMGRPPAHPVTFLVRHAALEHGGTTQLDSRLDLLPAKLDSKPTTLRLPVATIAADAVE
jgi:hypothetical protein